jgi:hypothetical protein
MLASNSTPAWAGLITAMTRELAALVLKPPVRINEYFEHGIRSFSMRGRGNLITWGRLIREISCIVILHLCNKDEIPMFRS